MASALYKRIRGILIGGALGDAFGMPTELWTQKMIQEEFPQGVQTFYAARNKGAVLRDMQAGQITDDTINTLFLIKMLVKNHGKIAVMDYLAQLREWSQNSEIADLVSGPSTRKALELLDQGVDIQLTGRFGTTNGAAMKIAPIGLLSDYRNLPQLVTNVAQICLPTHNTSIAIAGASSIAAAISYVSSGGTDLEELYQIAVEAVVLGLQEGYDVACPALLKRMEKVKALALSGQSEAAILQSLYEDFGTGVETIETIPAVFGLIFLAQGNPLKVASLAASVGGDTDTIGAIATSICGGLQPDFPLEMVELLERVNQLDFAAVTNEILPYAFFKQPAL